MASEGRKRVRHVDDRCRGARRFPPRARSSVDHPRPYAREGPAPWSTAPPEDTTLPATPHGARPSGWQAAQGLQGCDRDGALSRLYGPTRSVVGCARGSRLRPQEPGGDQDGRGAPPALRRGASAAGLRALVYGESVEGGRCDVVASWGSRASTASRRLSNVKTSVRTLGGGCGQSAGGLSRPSGLASGALGGCTMPAPHVT